MLQPQPEISPFLTSVFSCLSPKSYSRLTFSMACSHLNDFPGYFKMKSSQWRGSSRLFLVRNLCKAQKQRFWPRWPTLLGENPQLNSFAVAINGWFGQCALSWKINGSSKVFPRCSCNLYPPFWLIFILITWFLLCLLPLFFWITKS